MHGRCSCQKLHTLKEQPKNLSEKNEHFYDPFTNLQMRTITQHGKIYPPAVSHISRATQDR